MPLRLIGGALVKWLGGGTLVAVLLGGAGYFYHDWQTGRLEAAVAEAEERAETLRVNRDEWRTAAERAEARAERLAAERDAAREAQQALQQKLAAREADYERLRERIAAAPDADDGPVAPVLRETLEGLP